MVSCAAGPCPDDKKIMSTTEVDLSEIPAVSLRRVWQLTLKAWPFMRPLVKHLLILGGLILFMTLVLAGVALVGTDLFNNKILVGDKLQPLHLPNHRHLIPREELGGEDIVYSILR